MAMPVGGQTGDALGCTEASRRLSFPARMYVAQKANPIRICLMIWDRKMLRSGTRSFETLTSELEFAIGVISGLLVLALGLSPLIHRIFAKKKGF
jgi:hypothetical protein